MRVRWWFGLLTIILMSLVLAACGGGDDEEEPTVAPTAPPVATEAPTEAATATETEAISRATAIASPALVASPVSGLATPEIVASPVGMATPAMGSALAGALLASPVASPVAAMVPPVLGDEATPAASPAARVTLAGVVTLPGTVNEAYILSDEGCVGLGADADLRAGRQVVVRDETGTIIGVTELAASDETDSCAWTFAVEVPESTFYAVSIPMKTERVFTHDEVEEHGGELAIPVR